MNVIDLSDGNAYEAGADGYIIKAGQGGLEYNWRDLTARARADGKLCGLYWVIDARYSPEYHKAAIKAAFPSGYFGELGFWLDIEKPRTDMTDDEYNRLPYRGYQLIESVWRGVGSFAAWPGFYFSPGSFDLILSGSSSALRDEWAAKSPLWIAHYGVSSPALRGAWRSWQLWQWRSEPDYNRIEPAWWESVSRETQAQAYVIVRDRAAVDLQLTPAPDPISDVLPLRSPEVHAELNGWQAAINFGAGFSGAGADAARVFGRSVSRGIEYSDNGDWGYIEIDSQTIIPFARRMIDQGAINPDLDTTYLAPWSMLGADDRRWYLIVLYGLEAYAGMTQMQAAQWARARGITQLWLGDSGHSSWALEYGQVLYSAYGERTPQAIGFKIREAGDTMKGIAKAGTRSNVKIAQTGEIKATMYGGDYVFGELSTAQTDLINFDHFYRANGERFELGALSKVTTENMIKPLSTDSEPAPLPPPPAGSSPHLYQELTVDGVVWVFEADGTKK